MANDYPKMAWSPKAAKEYFDKVFPGEITLDGSHVVVRMDHDTAEWIASRLEQSDGFTNALWWHVYELKKSLLSESRRE